MSQKTEYLYEFGPFVLDTAQHLLLKANQPVQLTPKTHDTLLVLVENHGRLLTKSELMSAVWPNTFVEESNLTQQISMIRRALGESAGEDRYIVTVPGKGYRFAAVVTQTSRELPQAATEDTPPAAPDLSISTPRRSRNLQILLAVTALFVAVVSAWFYYHRGVVLAAPRSLAILPFQSVREDATNNFLGFSLADAVITKLGYVRSLTVRPSSAIRAYKNQTLDVTKVARELKVDTVLMGNYIRDGNDIRITSQLIDVKSNSIIWRETFDLRYEKLLTLQDSVAHRIIEGLRLSLSPSEEERLRPDKQIAPLAYEYYLRGVDLYANNDFPMAVKMLEQVTQSEPDYAPAWASLGRAHSAAASFEFGGRAAYQQAQTAYEKALALQPTLIEAKVYMANFYTDTGKPEKAVPLLRDALGVNPSNAEVHWELGYAYRFAGMLEESAAECKRARELDPGVKLNSSALNAYLYMGAYDKFLQSLPQSDSPLILFYKGFGEYHKGNRLQAVEYFSRAYKARRTPQTVVGEALVEVERGNAPGAITLLNDTEKRMQERDVRDSEAAYKIAQAYAIAGDQAAALRVLRRSVETGFFAYSYLQSDPLMQSLRGQPQFTELLNLAKSRHQAFKKSFF